MLNVTVTLHFDLMNLKPISIKHNHTVPYEDFTSSAFLVNNRPNVCVRCNYDLDLWLDDLKDQKGHTLYMTKQRTLNHTLYMTKQRTLNHTLYMTKQRTLNHTLYMTKQRTLNSIILVLLVKRISFLHKKSMWSWHLFNDLLINTCHTNFPA